MNAVKVTVGIPTSNRARLLAESIRSVLAQTYTNFSLIVSDNASDDDVLYPDHLKSTVELLERFRSVGLAHSKFDLINARSRVIERATPLVSRSAVTIERRDRALERMMVSGWGLCFASVTYRTRAIVEAGGFREAEEPFGDRELWTRVALNWDFGYIDTPSSDSATIPRRSPRTSQSDRATSGVLASRGSATRGRRVRSALRGSTTQQYHLEQG